MNILGIDFGTTKTLAARWDERAKTARTIRLGRSGDAIPTTIYADKAGSFHFGDEADDMRAIDFAGWKGRIKRDLGKRSSVILNGCRYPVVDLIAKFLEYVLHRVEEEVFYGKVDRTVITVPALYGPAERDELKQAALKAGFKNLELLEEPVAAGLAFLHEKAGTELGDHILVFDWGGGTLDLALVNHQKGEFSLNHEWIGGDKNLGGEDIDDSVIDGVDSMCAENHGRIDAQEDHRRLHIRRNLKDGKELLSRRTEHTFRLPFEQPVEFNWSRNDFENYTAFTISRALACLEAQLRKLAEAGLKPQQLLLVGGSSSMPVVKRRIEQDFGIKALLWENSQTAVALGAAISSHGLSPIQSPKTNITFQEIRKSSSSSSEVAHKPIPESRHVTQAGGMSTSAAERKPHLELRNKPPSIPKQYAKERVGLKKVAPASTVNLHSTDTLPPNASSTNQIKGKSGHLHQDDKSKVDEPWDRQNQNSSETFRWLYIGGGIALIILGIAGVSFGGFPAAMLCIWGFKLLGEAGKN